MRKIKGGITAPAGFKAAGVACGIKDGKKDLAIVVSETDCVAAGVFTTNRVKAAPVEVTRRHLRGRKSARAVVVSSGNANSCTGEKGHQDALRMTELCGERLGIPSREVLVASTGTIGKVLPMEKVEEGIRLAAEALRKNGAHDAAEAILTTDTVTKEVALAETIAGTRVRLGAMAKGAGMIEPNMATMLAFITTDVLIEENALQECLTIAVNRSFNRITVDGDQSTNDMVLAFANGLAGNKKIGRGANKRLLQNMLDAACSELARMIVKDGEGATRFIAVTVKGSRSPAEADRAARAVANSNLVKTALHGGSPNWGRIMAALGYSGARVKRDLVDVYLCGTRVARDGAPTDFSARKLFSALQRKEIEIIIDLNSGDAGQTVWTCDFSAEYVEINK